MEELLPSALWGVCSGQGLEPLLGLLTLWEVGSWEHAEGLCGQHVPSFHVALRNAVVFLES